MKKDLDYYMNLPYLIVVNKIPDDLGGGYLAYMPELGKYAFCGDGDNPEDAVKNLTEIQKDIFMHHIEMGIKIPLPGSCGLIFTYNKDGQYEVDKL